MDKQSAIGVFDSGLGGLTAVKEIKKILPRENLVYFGDTGRVPYGTRSKETIIKFVRESLNFLISFDLKMILIACGTATSTALSEIKDEYPIPVFGVIDPSAETAARITKNNRVAVIATPATINSSAYKRKISENRPQIEVLEKACPLFVPMIEDGRFQKDEPIVKIMVKEYLGEVKDFDPDVLILGCTHYPLIAGAIADFLGHGMQYINSGLEGALELKKRLSQSNLLADREKGEARFFVSDNVYNFSKTAENFLNEKIDRVEKIDIDDLMRNV